jgi:SAM-dependent methyltransferase
MSLEFHEIAETNHRILNPFTYDKLMLVGKVCRLKMGMRQLDLCCGKGEMLCQWGQYWGTGGVGVDISKVFLEAARQRAVELSVDDRVRFVEGDAAQYVAGQNFEQGDRFDIVSCIGATWIGNGLVGTLKLMLPALKDGGLLLVGEPYWIDTPPEEAYAGIGVGKDDYTSLMGTLERFHAAGLELVEMVLANPDSWDRYEAGWLRANPDDPRAPGIRQMFETSQREYFAYQRRYFGWGVFVLKVK